jgi:small multidrug resistance pump
MLSIPPYLVLSIAIGLEVLATSWFPKTEQFTALIPTLFGVEQGLALS